MADRAGLIEAACAAMIAGDPSEAEALLTRFHRSVERRPLEPAEQGECTRALERLSRLAQAAVSGIDAARGWLAELAQGHGGLDVYDRGGRQRVSTSLVEASQKF